MQLSSKKTLAGILTPNSYRTSAATSSTRSFQKVSGLNTHKTNTTDQYLPKSIFPESSLSPKAKFIRPNNDRYFNGLRRKEYSENEPELTSQTSNTHNNSGTTFLASLKMTPTSGRRAHNVSSSHRNLPIRSKVSLEVANTTELYGKDLVTSKLESNLLHKSQDLGHYPHSVNISSTEQGILPKIDNLQNKERSERFTKNLFINTDHNTVKSAISTPQEHKTNFLTPKDTPKNSAAKPESNRTFEIATEDSSFKKNFPLKSQFSARTNLTKNGLLQPIKEIKTSLVENSIEISQTTTSTPKLIKKIQNRPTATYRHLIFSPHIDKNTFKKHLMLVHSGLIYSTQYLRGPSEKFLESKQINLGDPSAGILSKPSDKKTLVLDLDETLIKSCPGASDYDKIVYARKDDQTFQIPFKIRPYIDLFLKKLKNYYEIIIFTASVRHYAEAIIEEIDPEGVITYILDRSYCLETKNGYAIKDLRIIKNRELKNMIIVDNLVHSFGLQIENGIPILEWNGEKEDTELKHLIDYLVEASYADDVREFNKENLKLREFASIQLNSMMHHI